MRQYILHSCGKVAVIFCFQIQRNTTDPVYKERFLFNVTPETLDDKIIQFHLFAIDKYQRHKVVGEAEMRVGDVDLRMPIKMWLNLRDIDDVSLNL